jgi:hypothetical protein
MYLLENSLGEGVFPRELTCVLREIDTKWNFPKNVFVETITLIPEKLKLKNKIRVVTSKSMKLEWVAHVTFIIRLF